MRFVLIAASMLFSLQNAAQINVTTLGIQLKPTVPTKFFGTGPALSTNDDLSVLFTPQFGMNFGMVIRRGLTKNWSIETGINLVQRNYKLDFMHPQLLQSQQVRFRLIGYEIPMQALVYVRLGEHLWMNASGGFAIDMYPSNVESYGSLRQDTTIYDFYQKTFRNGWLQFSLLANYGFEYRTKDKGYFYLGASFHRPFKDIGITEAVMEIDSYSSSLLYSLNGTYLTADLRYFFHEKPEKKKTMKKKPGE